MSSILYYSNFCDHSKKLLQTLSKTNASQNIHFICIDKRSKDASGKIFIDLENGQKIVMPQNITRVPALLLLQQNYTVLYGESILNHLRPKQEVEVREATRNNMEPMALSLGGSGGIANVLSDSYSFLDQSSDELSASGDGGLRQMHNYVDLYSSNMPNMQAMEQNNANTTIRGSTKMSEDQNNNVMADRLKQMQEQRDADIKKLTGNRPPI